MIKVFGHAKDTDENTTAAVRRRPVDQRLTAGERERLRAAPGPGVTCRAKRVCSRSATLASGMLSTSAEKRAV